MSHHRSLSGVFAFIVGLIGLAGLLAALSLPVAAQSGVDRPIADLGDGPTVGHPPLTTTVFVPVHSPINLPPPDWHATIPPTRSVPARRTVSSPEGVDRSSVAYLSSRPRSGFEGNSRADRAVPENSKGSLAAPLAPFTLPMPGSADLAICLDTERVWGVVAAGEPVTVAVGTTQMGASLADTGGFFWTTLYNSSGDRPGLTAGNVVTIYHGASSAGVTLRAISGQVNPLTNIVSGTISGVASPISVTVYVPGGEPSMTSYSRTVSSNAAGYFVANFSGLFDLKSDDQAVVAYVENGIEVHRHVYPAQSLYVGQVWQEAGGYAAPGSEVTVTLYLSNGVTAKETITLTTDASNGLFYTNFVTDVLESDVVVANLANGATLSRTVEPLTEFVDEANDRVLGRAEPGAVVLGVASPLTSLGSQNVRLGTVADAGGVYTLSFGGLADLLPGNWVGVYVADPAGDDLELWQPALGSIEVNQTWNEVAGMDAVPPPLREPLAPVTLTVYSAASASETTYTTFPQSWGWYSFSPKDFPAMPDIVPGDVITVENGGWTGVVSVMTLTVQIDTAANRFTGTVVSPTQRVELSGNYNQPQLYPANGQFALLVTATDPFTATPGGFDVRGDLAYNVAHRAAGDYVESISRSTDDFGAAPPYNAYGGVINPPGTAYTVTLYHGGVFKAQMTGTSDQPGGNIWNDFGSTGQQIEPGDSLQIQSAAGFSYTMEIPSISIHPDIATNVVSGYGPANALLLVNIDSQGRGFVPTDDTGRFAVAVNQLQEFWGNGYLQWGDNVNVTYYDANNIWLFYAFNWPQIFARYQMDTVNDVFGFNAFPGSTIYFTVTNPTSGTIATGSTSAGTDWGGPASYQLDFPQNALAPGNTVTANFGDGFIDAVTVVTITGYADPVAEIITGTAPANSQLSAFAQRRSGGQSDSLNNIQVDATGVYTAAFKVGMVDWDIQYGDTFHVYYPAPHGHNVEYVFWLPAPDVSVNKWNPSGGYARPGGVMVYGIQYSNWGNGDAENTIITDTLPMYTSYAGDNSGVSHEIGTDGVITWNLGTVVPNTDRAFMVTLNVSPGSGNIPDNCAGIATTSPGDSNLGNDWSCTGSVNVQADEVEIGVDKWPTPSDPAPGQKFEYTLQVCNNRGAAAGPVWLTDTLPLSTTLMDWWPENWQNNYWTEVSRTGGQLVLYAPGLSGNMCDRVHAQLQVDAGAPFFTSLTNSIVAAVEGDVDLNNNQRTTTTHVSLPRYDLAVSKNTNNGVMVPGGWINYHINYRNQGNTATHAWVTDTLPPGTTYQPGSAREQNGGPAFPPALVTSDSVVWDLGMLGVNQDYGFDFSVNISDAVTPTTVLTNCATIGSAGLEDTPWDNRSCVAETLYNPGPNLRVVKQSNWQNNYGQLRYDVEFQNIGDQQIDNVVLTDTLPAGTIYGGWWNVDFDRSRFSDVSQSGNILTWTISTLYAGDSGWLHYDANLDPDARPGWYTNTVEIGPTDAYPDDNTAMRVDVSGEVNRVELRVGVNRIDMWGQAQPNRPLTITTPSTEVTATVRGDGNWNIYQEGSSIQPGDTVTVTAGNGTLPVVIHVPDPFTVQADSITDRVWGRIDSLDHQSIEVDLSNYLNASAQTDASGTFTCTFADVPRGGNGEVRYSTLADNADVVFHHDFQSPDLLLNVNYGDDWVEGNYETGHTVWITVTQSDGTSIKGSAVLTTGLVPWWNGNTGFSTNWQGWSGVRPDIMPGDWVYGTVDNGYTSTVQVGTINGRVNASTDSITGTVIAPWFTQVLNIECLSWGGPNGAPNKNSTAAPDGSTPYACQWNPSTEWDILPGQNVGVDYIEPDGDRVYNTFHDPAARLNIQTWGNNQPGVGGNYALTIRADNQGDAPAADTLVTSTLEGMTYLSDGSGYPAFVTGSVITWNVGTVPANSSNQFEVFVHVDAAQDENITNTVEIGTASFDQTDGVSKMASWSGTVQPSNADVTVDAGTWTWQPAPGYDYVYNANVCNKGSTGLAEVTLTNTLPLSTSLVSWWGQNPGWTQVLSATNQLVVSRPTLSGGQCEQVYMRVHLNADALSGDWLHYMALVGASNDSNSGNNQSDVWHNVGGPYYDLSISKNWNWGQLAPGGEVRYGINYNNSGSLPITTTIRVTDTLPQNTTFLGAWYYDQQGQHPITPTITAADYLAWDIPGLDNGFGNNFEIALRLNSGLTPGTVFTNCATIAADIPEYNNPYDNEQCVADTVRASGPNLRVTKTADWQNNGSQIQYRVHFENIGATSISSVIVTDTYPESMTLNWSNANWQPSQITNDSVNHVLTLTLGSPFDPGNAADLNMQFSVPGVPNGTFFTNTAEITTPPGDVNPADNLVQQVSATGPDLSVEKWLTGGSATPRPGELLTYTLHLANKSTQWGISGQSLITDTLPTGLEFVSAHWRLCEPGNFFCESTPSQAGSILTWTWGSGCPNCWNDLILTARVTDTAQFGDVLTNTAQIASEYPTTDVEPDYTNNRSEVVVRVINPKFMTGKVYEGNRVAGTVVTYTLTVTNQGDYTGTNVSLIDQLPGNLTYGGGTYSGDWITWTIPAIVPDNGTATRWFSGTLSCTAGGNVMNQYYRVGSSDQGVTSTDGLPVSFTIAAPAINTSMTHSPGPFVVSDTVQFTATASTNGTPLSYAWDFGDGSNASGLTASHVYTQAGSYTAIFTAIDACGFTGVQTSTIAVNAPTINADFNQSAASVVVSSTVYFTDTSTTNGPTIVAWDWDFGDGAAHVFTQNANHTYLTSSVRTVRLVVTDALGYSASHTSTVTVNVPTINANFNQSATNIVVNNTVYFTDTSTTDGPSIVAWGWNFGDGGLSTAQHPTHLYTTIGSYTVTLLITDSLGYTATRSNVNAVSVQSGCTELTNITFTYAPNKPLIHTSVAFTATIVPITATSPITYVWNFGEGSPVTVSTPTIQHAYLVTGTQMVSVTAYNLCTPLGVSAQNTISIEAYRVFLPLVVKNH